MQAAIRFWQRRCWLMNEQIFFNGLACEQRKIFSAKRFRFYREKREAIKNLIMSSEVICVCGDELAEVKASEWKLSWARHVAMSLQLFSVSGG
jgi:hypothetical protein